MMKVKLMNKISQVGLKVFNDSYVYGDSVENAEAILVRSAKLHDMEFDPELACIARAGAGVNNIPIDRCSEAGIVVFNTPGANANAVKELALAGMLLAARDIIGGIDYAKGLVGTEGVAKAVEANKSKFAGYELAGKTLVVIGLGAIGGPLANMAVQLGMSVIGYDPYVSVNAAWNINSAVRHGLKLEECLAEADYVSLHIPLTKDTKGYLGAAQFEAMKPGCRVMNFSRGEIVDNEAMLAAIESGKVAKYVTDFPDETMVGKAGVIAIPHLGASTEESEDNCARMAAEEIRAYLEHGVIRNSVNFPDCDMGMLASPARLVVLHKNIPAMVSKISHNLGEEGINIETMNNRSRGELAVSILDVDKVPEAEKLQHLEATEGIIKVRLIEA
ncbi:MAG: 3-phosphoglycerate dehydrogenase [Firmicutes bacterium]|nr:3-phosphoglycerate dehydrogenase [Bacillota bacterium]